jgi:hypothetical protein
MLLIATVSFAGPLEDFQMKEGTIIDTGTRDYECTKGVRDNLNMNNLPTSAYQFNKISIAVPACVGFTEKGNNAVEIHYGNFNNSSVVAIIVMEKFSGHFTAVLFQDGQEQWYSTPFSTSAQNIKVRMTEMSYSLTLKILESMYPAVKSKEFNVTHYGN